MSEELSVKNIGVLNRSLIEAIRSGGDEKYKTVVKENLGILLNSLPEAVDSVTSEQLMKLDDTMKLLKDMLHLNTYPLLTNLIKKSWDNLGKFLISEGSKRRTVSYPKSAYGEYPYPYYAWKEYRKKFGKTATLKRAYEYYLSKVIDEPEKCSDRYIEIDNEPTPDNEIERIEQLGFIDAMKYYFSDGHKKPDYLNVHDVLREGAEKLLSDVEKNTRRIVAKVKELPKEEIAQLNKERDLKKLMEKAVDLNFRHSN